MVTQSPTPTDICCSMSASTSSSYHSGKSSDGFPKRLADTIVFKWTHSKLRLKHAVRKVYRRKYKVKNVEECAVQSPVGSINRKSVLYDCLSSIGPISFSTLPKTYGLEDLPDDLLMRIMKQVEDPRPLASVNSRFNRLLVDNIDSFPRISLRREIVYRFDQIRKRTNIFVLKEGRTFRTPARQCCALEEVFSRSPVRLSCKITFETGVPVAEEVIDILKLYHEGLLTVTQITFTGGALSTESRPDIRHVSLFTSKHFRYDLRIFELVNELDSLGILYSRKPAFVLTPNNIKCIAKSWLRLTNPHDATVYARLAEDSEAADFEGFCLKGVITVKTQETGKVTSVVCSSYSSESLLTFELFT
uniref:F-box domain-containing protein n=1 Tax=Steinernema glaseri TaxID=37863 RepID=A0A1I7ZFS6_9BILA